MKKLQLVVVLLMAVLLTSNAVAGAYWSGGATGPWNDTWTWGNATNYPVAGDQAYTTSGGTVTIDGTAEAVGELHHSSWSGSTNTLDIINGGSLDVSIVNYIGVAAGDIAILNIDATSSYSTGAAFNLGYNGSGTVNVSGTLDALGGLYVSNPWAAGTGDGTLNILDGVVNAVDFAMSANGLINIEAGALSIYGLWWDATLNGLIGANQIVGYGGTQAVNIDHVGDYTVLTAVPEPMTLSLLGLGMLGVLRRKK
ncbi:MAG: PEP-CTERM sorting domain-containing protein [Anaerohalosphaeraceae bacterium]